MNSKYACLPGDGLPDAENHAARKRRRSLDSCGGCSSGDEEIPGRTRICVLSGLLTCTEQVLAAKLMQIIQKYSDK